MEQNLGPVSQIGYHPGILVDRIVVFDQLLVCKPFYFTGFLVIYSAIKYNNIYISMIDQDRSQDLKLEGRQFYAGGLWVAFRSPLGPGQSPSGGSGG